MSELSIFEKSQEIRFETQQYANTRERVANVLDDINDTKANKEDVAIAIQAVLDELGITEQELYAYIDEIKLDLNKKMDKPFWAGFEQHYFVISSNGTSNLRPITLSANQLPYWAGNTFFNSNIYTTGGGNIGIGTSAPTERFEVNGNIKANAIYLPVNSTSPVAYKLRSDGSFLYYTDGNNVENKLAYFKDLEKVFIYTPLGNFNLSTVKAAMEATGKIFNDAHIILNLGTVNLTCNIDLEVNHICTLARRGSGSVSFTSSRTLNAGEDNITIMNGNESSVALIQCGTSINFLTVRNK